MFHYEFKDKPKNPRKTIAKRIDEALAAQGEAGALHAHYIALYGRLFWEAMIAVPYQWWGFQPKEMLGLFVKGFSGVPVEKPIPRIGVTWATIIIYELISTLLFIESSRSK
jgi:hypothetical protein